MLALLATSACGGNVENAKGGASDAGPGSADAPAVGSDAAPDVEEQAETGPGLLAVPLFSCDGIGYTVGATIGFAVYPSDGLTPQALLAHADGKLLAGKRSPGRPGPPAERDAAPNADVAAAGMVLANP